MWLSLAFLSAAMLGFYDVFKKYSLRNNAVLPVLFLNTLFCALQFVPVFILSGMGITDNSHPLYIAPWVWDEQLFILAKAVIVLSSWIFGYFAIKHLPITIVGPVNATRPVLTLTGAMLVFGESLNLWQWAGVTLALVSFYLLSKSGKKEGIRFAHNRWIYFLVAAALIGACSGLYDKFLMAPAESGGIALHRLTVQAWHNIYQCGIMAIILLVLWLPRRSSTTPFRWTWAIPMISIFITFADFVYFQALSEPEAMVSIVSMVRRGSVIVSFCFGAMIFHEKNLRAKAFDLLLVAIGLFCLWMGGQ